MTGPTRRDVLKLAALPALGAAVDPSPLASEGRRLVRAYRAAYATLRVASDAYHGHEADAPRSVWQPLEDRVDSAYVAARGCGDELRAFVVRATGHAPMSGPPEESNQIDLDTAPGAAAVIDGVLWVAHQDADGDPGELILANVPVADVLNLTPGANGGAL